MPSVPRVKRSQELSGEPTWFYRRSMAFLIVGFCMLVVLGLGLLPPIADTEVNGKIVDGAFWLLATIFFLYGGYGTAQDLTAIIKTGSARPDADPAPAVNTIETETKTKTVVAADPVNPEPPMPPAG